MIGVLLAAVGLSLGSFVNALVWRVHEQSKAGKDKRPNEKLSIINGRSMCVNCKHELSMGDLIPVFSWLWLRGKCRYCKKPIEDSPIVEVAVAMVFVVSYIVWSGGVDNRSSWLALITWLLSSVGLTALAVYDFKWMLLPNRILYPTALIAAAGTLIRIICCEPSPGHALIMLVASVAVASGIFWVLYQLSRGKWIGYGDVRLGLITGVLLADPLKSALMIFIASLIGSLVALPGLLSGRKTVLSKIPYGPYLILATFIAILWGQQIIDWYKRFILLNG